MQLLMADTREEHHDTKHRNLTHHSRSEATSEGTTLWLKEEDANCPTQMLTIHSVVHEQTNRYESPVGEDITEQSTSRFHKLIIVQTGPGSMQCPKGRGDLDLLCHPIN